MEQSAWNTLVGHEWAAELLSDAIRYNRVGHAYLITGPEQIGKTTLARLFAQALNCLATDPAQHPCGNCRSCHLIASDRHPDVRILEPEVSSRGKRTLKIDEIRELQHDLSLAAYEARWKVAIITHFDAATTGAANAFLKTLEEPPANVALILTATEADTLLPTIASRCRVLALRPLTPARIAQALQQRQQVQPEEATRLAALADGRLGWAFQAAVQPELLQERDSHLAHLEELLSGRRVQRFAKAEKLGKSAEELPALLRTWSSWWRDLALLVYGGGFDDAVVNVDHRPLLRKLGAQWQRDEIINALQQTQKALWQLEHNGNTRLVLENLFLRYPYLER